MRIAHLIMAYKDPKQIERLIRKMSYKDNKFFIHIDKKIDDTPFKYLEQEKLAVLIKNRTLVNWAGFSFTTAIIECIREIFRSGTYDYINLLSGQDYPIKSNEHIQNYLSKNTNSCFMSLEAFGTDWWSTARQRIEKYHLTDYPFKGHYRLQQLVNLITPIRKFPADYTLYGGNCATWWTLSKECLDYLLQFIDNNPKVRHFSKLTWAPDEFLIPTLVMNSEFKNQVVNNNLRYIDWSLGGANPKILTTNDFEEIKQSDKLFARKFDIKVDNVILDLVDEITE